MNVSTLIHLLMAAKLVLVYGLIVIVFDRLSGVIAFRAKTACDLWKTLPITFVYESESESIVST